ncbi:MAG: anthranilate synthase component I [Caldilineaceae bacterium]|nr:anthranilate synthase component I [Caldilineaceae bacterium]
MAPQYKPTLDEVRTFVGQGNIIAIHRELPADLETPVSVYLKLQSGGQSPSFLLESVEKGEQVGRYSFIGVNHPLTVSAVGDHVIVGAAGGAVLEEERGDPLQIVKELMAGRKSVRLPGLPLFNGGVVGYFGYDLVRFMERLPATAERKLDIPDMVLLFTDNLVVFDHVRHKLIVIANMRMEDDLRGAYADAVARIDQIIARLNQPLVPPQPAVINSDVPWTSNFTQAEFEENVRKAKEYIKAGDIFQVVLSQRLSRPTDADPFTVYRALRMLNPSPYMFFFDFSGVAGVTGETVRIIGASPEMHVRLEDDMAYLHPIAGTRWRGKTEAEDNQLAEDLMNDPKERAEHVMLVDLGRNDLGRVCEYGSVNVPTMMAIERYSHVMHIVSDVRGKVQPDQDAYTLLRATFPAGTVSGAPKVRAMEIIEELEGVRRGAYAGAVGYIDYDGNMDTCITIRTITMKGNVCHLQAGGGLVADSDPTYEYNESMNKMKALSVAVANAEAGLL